MVLRRRETGLVADRRRTAAKVNAMMAMTEAEREAVEAQTREKSHADWLREKQALKSLEGEALETHKATRKVTKATADKKRLDTESFFGTVVKNARRRLQTGVRDQRGDVPLQVAIALQMEMLLLRAGFAWPPSSLLPPRSSVTGEAREWLLRESKRPQALELLHPSRVVGFVEAMAAATGLDIGEVDATLVDAYRPSYRPIWFQRGQALTTGWARTAVLSEDCQRISTAPSF